MAEYYLYPIFDAPWGTWYLTFHNSNVNTGFLGIVSPPEGVKPNLPSKICIDPSFQRRGSIDLQKKEAQEKLQYRKKYFTIII